MTSEIPHICRNTYLFFSVSVSEMSVGPHGEAGHFTRCKGMSAGHKKNPPYNDNENKNQKKSVYVLSNNRI
jgi:hypothetical protein